MNIGQTRTNGESYYTDVNLNMGEPIGRERRPVVADSTVFHERGRESRVVLPVIPIAP